MKHVFAAILVVALMLTMGLSSVSAATYNSVLVEARTDAPTIEIDGVVTRSEWGMPIGSWTREQILAIEAWDAWQPSKEFPDADGKKLELFARRDANNLYLAVRLIHAHKHETGFNESTDIKNLWKYANLVFTMGAYDEQTNIVNGIHKGETYERYLKYTLVERYNEDTSEYTDMAHVEGMGSDSYPDLEAFCIGWDEATKTYTYEMAIPFTDLAGYIEPDSDVVLSMTITDAQVDKNAGGNQWQISTVTKYIGSQYQAFRVRNPLHIAFSDDVSHEVIEEESTEPQPEVPQDEPAQEVPSNEEEPVTFSPWYIVIAVVLVVATGIVIIYIIKSKKENHHEK